MNSVTRVVVAVAAGVVVLSAAAYGAFQYAVANFGAIAAELPEPPNGEIERLGRDHFLKAKARLAESRDAYERWANLGDAALGSSLFGDPDEATKLAEELLALADGYRSDWNYGNAIHKAHLAMGHVALTRGDVEAAKRHLVAAGATPGSPQLNSFGPRMTLARELLRRGEREAVLAYIASLRKFWAMDNGALDKWDSMIRGGRTPSFWMNLY